MDLGNGTIGTVLGDNDGVATLVGLEGDVLLGLEAVALELLDLRREDSLRGSGGVDTRGLDRDDAVAVVLQEVLGVVGNDTGLVRLRNIGEDDVNHVDLHAVGKGVARILDDGDDVGAALGHSREVTARAEGALDGIHHALGADKVRHVGDSGTGGSTDVEDLGAGLDVDVLKATNDGGTKLGTEGVPDTVLNLALVGLDSDTLLAVDGGAGVHVAGRKSVVLATGKEDTVETVALNDNLGAASLGTATATTATTAATAATTATTATAATTAEAATAAARGAATAAAEA